jgi:hypothetical protein
MNDFTTRALIVACIAASLSVAACSKKVTVSTSQGNVTVEQGAGGQTTTIKSNQGQVTVGKGTVDPASLGLPVYPGATQSDQGSMSVSDASKGAASQLVMLTTTDPFDKVYDYYKSQLPAGAQTAKVSTGGSQMATFEVGAGTKDEKGVIIQESGGKVTIELNHSAKQ